MKPPIFEYHRPETVPDAIDMLGTLENARLLAGGQSLMPMLTLRFAFPDHLIDLNRIPALVGVSEQTNLLRVGAMTRQRDLLEHPLVRARLPMLAEALNQVGHRQTRNRGTIGGSLCHLDPAAELVTVATALDATLHIAGPRGERTLAMADFPLGFMTTALEPDEILTAILFPLPPIAPGTCFTEFARRHGDYAIVSAAAVLWPDQGRIGRASITLGGVGPVPLRLDAAERALADQPASIPAFAAAAAACDTLDPMEDAQVPGWYRRRLAATLVKRALTTAWERAHAG